MMPRSISASSVRRRSGAQWASVLEMSGMPRARRSDRVRRHMTDDTPPCLPRRGCSWRKTDAGRPNPGRAAPGKRVGIERDPVRAALRPRAPLDLARQQDGAAGCRGRRCGDVGGQALEVRGQRLPAGHALRVERQHGHVVLGVRQRLPAAEPDRRGLGREAWRPLPQLPDAVAGHPFTLTARCSASATPTTSQRRATMSSGLTR